MEEILHDLEVIESFAEIGLILNNQKSEIICNDPVTRGTIIMALPGACVVEPSRATLLGSPIGNTCCISDALKDKINALEVMGDRLQHITAHDGILDPPPKLIFHPRTPLHPQNLPVSFPPISVLTMFCSSPSSAT